MLDQSMLSKAEQESADYSTDKDKDLVVEDSGERPEAQDYYMKAGQSKRIWNELYKVCL